jgi:hypothetical protein
VDLIRRQVFVRGAREGGEDGASLWSDAQAAGAEKLAWIVGVVADLSMFADSRPGQSVLDKIMS